ncbi:MAG: pyrroline-5-carboxylate reductase [Hyphomicrobiales bacterium]|nr:pyrroline-5-carboxylate reductase [Hyphomicrobiales bacterium]MBV9114808.1 pyrroline-5-carboxylate reductase [Hyphomicrobiales bacterium]
MSGELPSSLVLLGAGKMGQAMLTGWLARGLEPSRITAIDPHLDESGRALLSQKGVRLTKTPEGVSIPEAMVLAIKPQTLESAAEGGRKLIGKDTLVLSILAGKRIADLASRLGVSTAIVRAMPNTPAAVARGISAAVAVPGITQRQHAIADALLSSIGGVEWVDDEALIDPVTAVSGSGPAYVFWLVECLAEAGAKAGLPPELSMRLARATVEGAGELMFRDKSTEASTLRRNVTSPGGTTAAALEVLMAKDGLSPLMERAVAAASRRARELAG